MSLTSTNSIILFPISGEDRDRIPPLAIFKVSAESMTRLRNIRLQVHPRYPRPKAPFATAMIEINGLKKGYMLPNVPTIFGSAIRSVTMPDDLSKEDEFLEVLAWTLSTLKRRECIGVLPLRHEVIEVKDLVVRLEVSGPQREMALRESEEKNPVKEVLTEAIMWLL